MRQDLNKLLCERERVRSRDHYRNYRRNRRFNHALQDLEGENQPATESMRIRYGWMRKEFNENLNPLQGILRKSVGRPWDQFYSELCETFNMRSVINQHILQHLYDYICVNGVEIDDQKQVWVRDRWATTQRVEESHFLYYVDPRDGLIKANKHYRSWGQRKRDRWREQLANQPITQVYLDQNTVLNLIDGVWYQFSLEEIPLGQLTFKKPEHVHVFNSRRLGPVSWDRLTHAERILQGVKHFTGAAAKDAMTGQTVFRDPTGLVRVLEGNGSYVAVDATKYRATKKTANHKTLKQAGLIN